MAVQRKNRINSPSPEKDGSPNTQRGTPPRGSRTVLRALFSTSPTSFTPQNLSFFPSSSPNTASASGHLPTASSAGSAAAAASRFNPKLIFAQIVAIQSLHYLILSILFQIIHLFTGEKISLDRIFTTKYLQLWTMEGWYDNSAIVLSSIAASVLLAIIVEKSKKCLDFSITLFIIHFGFCWLYGGFPASWDWWVINVFGLIIMVLLGEYFCSRVELREIPLL